MNLEKVFHGTSKESAESIISNGINMHKTQSRDYGFFGSGFYVTKHNDIAEQHATTVSPSSPAIIKIDLSRNARVFNAGEQFQDGTYLPRGPASWHSDFIEWSLSKVSEAAVWEYTDKTKDEIISSAKEQRTPNSDKFESYRKQWYKEVTEYAEQRGYNVIYWTDGEIIIKSDDVVSNYEIIS